MKSSLFRSSLTLKGIQLPNKKVFRCPKILGKTYLYCLLESEVVRFKSCVLSLQRKHSKQIIIVVLYLCRPRENSCALAQFIESMGWMRACFIPFYADARELCKIQSPVAMYLLTKLSANREETYLRICKPVELQRQIESSYCVRLDNRVEDIITDSFSRFDCNYLDFRQFYVNWPKEIT